MSNKVILALGADIKNRPLVANGQKIFCGCDNGNLETASNYEKFQKNIANLIKKAGAKPRIIACDLHPGYFSTRFAKKQPVLFAKGYKLIQVQHHYAHIASVLAECNLKKPVIGVSFDGTGYGIDGNTWGGEFLVVKNYGFKRIAHLKYQKMPGGDKVVYEPWRMALGILGKKANPFLKGIAEKEKELILDMMAKNINSPLSSSAGRLFDACAALLGICTFASYEAEGPIKLEAMCDENIRGGYEFIISNRNGCYIIDTDGIFLGMLKDLKKDEKKYIIATRFHNSIAEIIVKTVKKLSRQTGIKDIVLSGGVFQNRFLIKNAVSGLRGLDLNLFTNKKFPVNDLNISLGQYYVSCHPSKG